MKTLEQLTEDWRQAVGSDSGLGKTLKYDFKGEGFIVIDGGSVTNEDKPTDLTLTGKLADMVEIFAGRLHSTKALMTGRIKISSMNVAMELGPKMEALLKRLPKD